MIKHEPVFPILNRTERDGNKTYYRHSFGNGCLTKLELFSAMAMQGMLAAPTTRKDTVAACAVAYAKALIRELEKEEK